jgi:hypothetical protein
MTTYARIVDGCAVDITTEDPKTIFHEDVAVEFVTVPDDTSHGDRVDADGAWTKAPQAVDIVPRHVPPTVTPAQFKMLMLAELPEILPLKSSDETVSAFFSVVDDPRLTEVDLSLTSVQNGIKYCLTKIGRTEAQLAQRMSEILSGVLT